MALENFNIIQTESGIRVEEFPEAVKIIKLNCGRSRQLASLQLNRADLNFALKSLCLIYDLINDEQQIIRESLWRSAIFHYFKCFSKSTSRIHLNEKKIYKENGALDVYRYFKNLRDKHYAHDENTCSQAHTGAVLNPKESPQKIAKIICVSSNQKLLDQNHFDLLKKLIIYALEWTDHTFESLCHEVVNMLEEIPYEKLLTSEAIQLQKPQPKDVDKPRQSI